MKITALVEAMVEAGATPAMILVAVRATEQQELKALEQRRKSDAERQARKRDRDAVSRDVTLRHSDRSLVRASDARVEDITSNLDTNSQEKIIRDTPPAVAKSKRGTRMPDDFEPDIDWAVSQGLTRPQATIEAAKFKDHWRAKPGQQGVKLDWPATWRNWVRNAVQRLPQPRAGPQPNLSQLYAVKERMERDRDQLESPQDTVRYLPAANG